MSTQFTIPTYIINLKYRTERKENVLKEFEGRNEFNVTVVEAIQHEVGAMGLWHTIKHVINDLANEEEEYILICEDDHQFTADYSKDVLLTCIAEAQSKNADVLCGGVSWFTNTFQVTDKIYWVEKFTGLQFTIIFKKFFNTVLNAHFKEHDAADQKIGDLTQNKFFIFPFISIQKDYGYSDATPKNNVEGRVAGIFAASAIKAQTIKQVNDFYTRFNANNIDNYNIPPDYNLLTIPTYIINLPERKDRREHIIAQFSEKSEFDITIVEAIKHEVGAYGLWLTIRQIIKEAIKNDDDVIIICEDDHEFTRDYTKEFLLKNIIESHRQGTEILAGGIGGFGMTIPVTNNLFWINWFYCTQFLVLYRSIFQKILDEEYDHQVTADGLLSEITSQKMVLYPFISVQKDFGYSDVTKTNDVLRGHIENLFLTTKEQLANYKGIYDQYLLKPAANSI